MLSEMFDMFVQSFWETLIMVGISGLIGAALGLPLGVLLFSPIATACCRTWR